MSDNNTNNNSGNSGTTSGETTSSTTTTMTTQFPRVVSEREMTKGEDVDYNVKHNSHFGDR